MTEEEIEQKLRRLFQPGHAVNCGCSKCDEVNKLLATLAIQDKRGWERVLP